MFKAKGLPDPGPTPSVDRVLISVLVPKRVAQAIDELHEFVVKEFPARSDFMEELLKEGLRSAAQAQQEALAAALQAKQAPVTEPDTVVDAEGRPALVVTNPGLDPVEAVKISDRLRALRGEGVAPTLAVKQRAGSPA